MKPRRKEEGDWEYMNQWFTKVLERKADLTRLVHEFCQHGSDVKDSGYYEALMTRSCASTG